MTRKPKEGVRQKILNTAEMLFARYGFDATGIELIAKTAGITKSLIYYYFNSKDEILSNLFQDFTAESIKIKKYIIRNTMSKKSLKSRPYPF
jgi:AcrR family transcriptional regulator